MKVSETFSGNYLTAADISQPKVYTISGDSQESMPDKKLKPVLWFHGETKGLVLNKTNANLIAGMYGDDTAYWTGHPIELYATTTEMSGKIVPCIRVRAPQQPAAQPPAVVPVQPAVAPPAAQQAPPQAQPPAAAPIPPQQPPAVYQAPAAPPPPIQAPPADVPFDA